MARTLTYSIVDHSDGRFAVVAVTALGSAYWRCGFLARAEAELCVEDLRVVMTACGVPLVHWEAGLSGTDQLLNLSAPKSAS
ncbi:hypothetical protein DK389_23035 [Methylobacterium durans]|uniref:Uncharacterized protein n=1 Tax=Methylobacterium durans TaxID=2202825 RepID=A0A2U8WA17_9HYPH|nr:hypothetical protein DK389_23035 [Methylobacterium durans]